MAADLDESSYERLVRKRVVYVGAEITDAVANRVCATLALLDAEDAQDIKLYLNSAGGSVTAGLAIYETMQLIAADVSTWGLGLVAGMAQFLLSAGTPGKRHVVPGARIALMQPASPRDSGSIVGLLGRMTRYVVETTAVHTGQLLEQVIADAVRNRWFSAYQARAYGLVDHVVRV